MLNGRKRTHTIPPPDMTIALFCMGGGEGRVWASRPWDGDELNHTMPSSTHKHNFVHIAFHSITPVYIYTHTHTKQNLLDNTHVSRSLSPRFHATILASSLHPRPTPQAPSLLPITYLLRGMGRSHRPPKRLGPSSSTYPPVLFCPRHGKTIK